MIQELFRVGPIAISPFGVLLVAAFLAAYWQLSRGLRQLDLGDADAAASLVVAGGLGGILGAKVYYAILHGDPKLLLERYGLVWYGGLIVGAAAVIWTMRRRRLPVWGTLDAAAPAMALGYAIGRVGCFLVGDDYGRPTDLPWGVAFENGLPPTTAYYLRTEFGVAIPADIPGATLMTVHPTQLYETAAALVIWILGVRLLGGRRRAGDVAIPVLALLAVERFLVEFLRAKDDRFLGPFTLAQAISLAVVATLLLLARRRPPAERPG
ncbi:MAG: prolipoprotein diacylglyceryl transferase [Thermoanaerobaculia bacterium]|nr:prolipoprotein diacylglyceryl transferase [Thermoanaerobaculia bacterium]